MEPKRNAYLKALMKPVIESDLEGNYQRAQTTLNTLIEQHKQDTDTSYWLNLFWSILEQKKLFKNLPPEVQSIWGPSAKLLDYKLIEANNIYHTRLDIANCVIDTFIGLLDEPTKIKLKGVCTKACPLNTNYTALEFNGRVDTGTEVQLDINAQAGEISVYGLHKGNISLLLGNIHLYNQQQEGIVTIKLEPRARTSVKVEGMAQTQANERVVYYPPYWDERKIQRRRLEDMLQINLTLGKLTIHP